MNPVVTEAQYPVQKRLMLKSVFYFLLIMIYVSGQFINLIASMFGLSDNRTSIQNPLAALFIFIFVLAISFFLPLLLYYLQIISFHYALEEKFMVLHQGFFSKQQRNLPYGTIQNVLIKRGILDRILGLTTLSIENAAQGGGGRKFFGMTMRSTEQNRRYDMVGFSQNKVSIPGLNTVDAEALKALVLQKMKENPIEDNQSGL